MNSLFQCLYGDSEILHCSATDYDNSDTDSDSTPSNNDESPSTNSNSCSLRKPLDLPAKSTSSSNILSSSILYSDDSGSDNDVFEVNTYLEASKDGSHSSISKFDSSKKPSSFKKSFDLPSKSKSSSNILSSSIPYSDDSDSDNDVVESNVYLQTSKDGSHFSISKCDSSKKPSSFKKSFDLRSKSKSSSNILSSSIPYRDDSGSNNDVVESNAHLQARKDGSHFSISGSDTSKKTFSCRKSFGFPSKITSSSNALSSSIPYSDDSDSDNDGVKSNTYLQASTNRSHCSISGSDTSKKTSTIKKSLGFTSSSNSLSSNSKTNHYNKNNETILFNTYFGSPASDNSTFKKSKYSSNNLSHTKMLENSSVKSLKNEKRVIPPVCINNLGDSTIKAYNKIPVTSVNRKRPFPCSRDGSQFNRLNAPYSYSKWHAIYINLANIYYTNLNKQLQFDENIAAHSDFNQGGTIKRLPGIVDNKSLSFSNCNASALATLPKSEMAFVSREEDTICYYQPPQEFECQTYCPLCSFNFPSKISFLFHLESLHKFSTKSHIHFIDQATAPSCKACRFVSNDVIKFFCHLNIHDISLTCSMCHVTFPSLAGHDRHRLASDCGKFYKCCICQIVINHNFLEEHKTKRHANCNHSDQCSALFTSSKSFAFHCYERHLLTIENANVCSIYSILPKRQCVYCLLFVSEAAFLSEHISNTHTSWLCRICHLRFDYCDLAVRHSYRHTDSLAVVDTSVKGTLVARTANQVPETVKSKEVNENSFRKNPFELAASISFDFGKFKKSKFIKS